LPLRDNVAPAGAPDDIVRAALESAGATNLATLDTVLARGYEGGTDLSGGQWQRIALARALAAVKLGGVSCRWMAKPHSLGRAEKRKPRRCSQRLGIAQPS
jgi:ABC-type hemin transport system ATPase subunit